MREGGREFYDLVGVFDVCVCLRGERIEERELSGRAEDGRSIHLLLLLEGGWRGEATVAVAVAVREEGYKVEHRERERLTTQTTTHFCICVCLRRFLSRVGVAPVAVALGIDPSVSVRSPFSSFSLLHPPLYPGPSSFVPIPFVRSFVRVWQKSSRNCREQKKKK